MNSMKARQTAATEGRSIESKTRPTAPPSSKPQLGFIIDDDLSSPAVLPSGQRVDVYGYISMVTAAVQAQGEEIADLRRTLARMSEQSAAAGCR